MKKSSFMKDSYSGIIVRLGGVITGHLVVTTGDH